MKRQILFTTLLMVSSTLMTACGGGGRLPSSVTAPVVEPTPAPAVNYPSAPVAAPIVDYPTSPVTTPNLSPTQPANTPSGSFEVDQDTLNQWQAKGIAVSGGTIYVAAVDKSLIFKKGTILKMNSTSGKSWKNLGSSFLGLKHKMDDTLSGVAVAGGNLFAIDSSNGMYSVKTSGGSVKHLKGAGGTDLAGTLNGVFVAANGLLERGDMSGASRAPMPGINASSGIGSDTRGNVFFINGPRVGVVDAGTGQARDIIMQGLAGPLDVAADGRNGELYVLEQAELKRFSSSGQLLARFPHGASQPSSVAVDEMGYVYVADFGSSHKDSKILKFNPPGMNGAMPGGMPTNGMGNGYNNGMGYNDPYSNGGGYNNGMGYNDPYSNGGGYNNGYNSGMGYNNGGYGATNPTYGDPYGNTGGYGSTTPTYGDPYGNNTGYGATNPTYGAYAAPQTQQAPVPVQNQNTGRKF